MPDFKFRLPTEIQLTDAQKIALEYPRSIVVSGGPGSGKTVVTIYKFLRPVRKNSDAILFTYNKTLLASIKGLLRDKSETLFGELDENRINNVINNKVLSFSKFYGSLSYINEDDVSSVFSNKISVRGNIRYSEILFDEAQDLTPAVFSKIHLLATQVSCGADNAQNLQGNFPPDEAVEIIHNHLSSQRPTDHQPLEANFRNTKEIFEFARSFVPENEHVQNIDISDLQKGELPEVIDGLNDEKQLDFIKEIIENNPTRNIGILVNNRNQVISIKEHLEKHSYSCKNTAIDTFSFSYYYNNMPFDDEQVLFDKMKTPFIVTYDSCKGLEFDIVIMPFFNYAEESLYNQRRKQVNGNWVSEYNIDGSPKMWATRNHYYVGATRAKANLYVLCSIFPSILGFHRKNNNLGNQKNNFFDDLPF